MLIHPFLDGFLEAGCDEAGRGCLAGPVVAAAVILPDIKIPEFIADSKILSFQQRLQAAQWIKANAVAFSISYCDVEEIEKYNILWASVKAMHQALDSLSVNPSRIIVDGNKFQSWKGVPYFVVPKGDQKIATVAAASILAKVYRDELMDELHYQHPIYKWNKNKGYSTIDHIKAIKKWGTTPHHRKKFVEKIQ